MLHFQTQQMFKNTHIKTPKYKNNKNQKQQKQTTTNPTPIKKNKQQQQNKQQQPTNKQKQNKLETYFFQFIWNLNTPNNIARKTSIRDY